MRRVLILCRSVVGSRMASPGIRSYHMARVLAEQLPEAEVTLAVPAPTDLATEALPFRMVRYDERSILSLVRAADIIISPSLPGYLVPFLLDKRVVLDLYTPYFPEWMAISQVDIHMGSRRTWMETNRRYLALQLTLADFVLCANERQRDLYVGMLTSLGLITPEVYDTDTSLNHVFAVVPYGVRPGTPAHTRQVLKGVHPGIRESDKVLLWNGTIIEWYDIEGLLCAIQRLSQERDDLKLYFLGTEYPALQTSELVHGLGGGVVRKAVDFCRELGLLDRSVFFNFDWCSYDETANYLLEADAGVCTYQDDIESRYAFRSRYVDLFWAEVPIICTQGDVLAELVERAPLGVAVPPNDVPALAEGIRRVLDDAPFVERCKENLQHVRQAYQWERVLQPLIRFCQGETLARDKRERFLPLLGRTASYAEARLYQYLRTKVTGWSRKLIKRLR